MKVRPAGLGAFVLDLEAPPSPDLALRIAALRNALAVTAPPEARDVVPAFASLLIEHRPTLTARARRAWLARALQGAPSAPPPREHTVRVAYGEGADREALAERLSLPWEEIVRVHAAHVATVAFVGFTPGFPYMLGLPEALHLPKRDTPRAHVPAGSVAIADGRGGLYPSDSPGGWWVLGRSDTWAFDPHTEPPLRFAGGDVVRFEAVEPRALRPRPSAPEAALDGPVEVLEATPGGADLQGAPRWGVGHYGMAQAGAWDPVALEAANRVLGNPRSTLAVESRGQPLTLRTEVDLWACVTGGGTAVAVDGRPAPAWVAFLWPAGGTLELLPDPSVSGRSAVVAIAGGWQGEAHRGSDSTDRRAGVGGSRRWLRPGDRLTPAGRATGSPLPHPGRPRYAPRVQVRLHPGPQYEPRAFDHLVRTAFRLRALDRTGARLEGPAVPIEAGAIDSDGSPFGAVQVPPDGQPLVLLADRGRTGGYAKPGVIDPRDAWRLAQARTGGEVWFVDARRGPVEAEPLDSDA